MTRLAVSPDLLRWARDRAGLLVDDLSGRFPTLAALLNARPARTTLTGR